MKPSAPIQSGFRFGIYEADLRSGELRKHGSKVKLQEQPFQVLTSLLENPGKVVIREQLQKKLWPTDTFVDFEHGLNTAIARLREALCDSADKPRYIETIPRRGYRFLMEVEKIGGESVSQKKKMLVVLPFENLDSDPSQEYFADGMTEEMISQLGRMSPMQLGVIARTSAMRYKRTNKSVDQIGSELNVDYVLEGSVRRAGPRVRITAQLIQVLDQTHLWAESYDRTLDDVLTIQTECANRIARSLAVELLPQQRDTMQRAATRHPAAFEAYLQGRYYWNKRTEEGFQKAIGFFEQAIAADPSYALAHVGVADVYNVLGMFSMVPPQEASGKARAAASKALALDDLLGEAHTSIGYTSFLYDWNWARAEQEFLNGLALNPNHVAGHYWFALYLAAMGRFNEALAHLQEARTLDPLSLVVHNHHGWVLYFARQYDEAIPQFQKTLDLDSNFSIANIFLGLAYLQKKRMPEGLSALAQGLAASGLHPDAVSVVASANAISGQQHNASRALNQIQKVAREQYVSPFFQALVALGLGNQDQALDFLEQAWRERSGWLVHLNVDPALDALRSHPRFQDLLDRMAYPSH